MVKQVKQSSLALAIHHSPVISSHIKSLLDIKQEVQFKDRYMLNI